ncbi:MAG: hypothetical protein AAGF86_04120 [Pseudomonadota bacterium]
MTSHMPLLLAILIGASIWIYTFTSWFPIFGSILGFGGVLAVVPVMQGLMSEERRGAYARRVDELLFQNPSSARFYVFLLCVGVFAGFICVQPLQLTNFKQSGSLDVRVGFSQQASDKPPTRRIRINAGATHSTPLLQPFFGGASYVWVSSPGLPQIRKKVSGFGWPSMTLPDDLWQQPILLLRPSPRLLEELYEREPTFKVFLKRKTGDKEKTHPCVIQKKYVGEPLWIGGGRQTFTIDQARIDQWVREFKLARIRREVKGEEEQILTSTLRPSCPEKRAFEQLKEGDVLTWHMKRDGTEDPFSLGTFTVDDDLPYPAEVRMLLNGKE